MQLPTLSLPSFERLFHRGHHAPGTPPGTLEAPPAPSPTRFDLAGYGPDVFDELEDATLEALPAWREHFPVVWLNVTGLGEVEVLARLRDILGLHRLTMEDVLNTSHRPKLEAFPGYHFLISKMGHWEEGVALEQVSLLLLPGLVVTIQEHTGDAFEPVRERIRRNTGIIRRQEAGYLAYSLLDSLIDGYFPILEACGERLEKLEADLLEGRHRPQALISEVHAMKRTLQLLHRVIWPLRDIATELLKEPSPRLPATLDPYFQDCRDHAIHLTELVQFYQDMAAGLLDTSLAYAGHRMNEVMKLLTMVATIFIPLTFLAGIYGMNFNPEASRWNMPELNWAYGYPVVLGVMVVLAAGMLWYFYRKGWLGRS